VSYPLPADNLPAFLVSVGKTLRRPAIEWDGTTAVARFTPDLDATEQQTYAELLRLHRSGIGMTAAEYVALRDDFAGLRAYHGLASPTAAQTAAAMKAVIRVLRAILD
jgi:hypothetical protein